MKKEFLPALVWGLLMIPMALAAKFAHEKGYIDADTMLRVVAMNGLWLAFYGNRLPKAFVPNACAREAKRFIGWVMVISGLTYAAFWAFAPIPMASIFGTGAVAVGLVLSLGYCVSLRGRRTA